MATWQVPKRYNNFPIKQLRESRGQSSDVYEEHDFMYCICLHDSTFFSPKERRSTRICVK